ncbi:hypothetical protein [Dialister invisus]|uniref:hypothetical protein n=1 Tax=Dialister invisus TaxID=218538 RepID=UPI0023FA15E9|nr:hypothetical protein [Dialister invisus]
MLTTEDLRDYLGVDSGNDKIIEQLQDEALDDLKKSTGIDWVGSENKTADSAIRAMVYLSFYGNRGEIKDPTFLDSFIRRKIVKLQTGTEAAQNGA